MKSKKVLVYVLLIFFLGSVPLFPTHSKNCKIFAKVIEAYLQKCDHVDEIYLQIDKIGKEALQRGLDLSIYNYNIHPATSELCFAAIPIWEGKNKLPITFFLYIWPSKEEAEKHPILGGYWASNIHSHPIKCAFTVIQGEITEHRFQQLSDCSGRMVQKIDQQIFTQGEKEVDLNKSPFIHQMAFEGKGKQPSVTLHVYGRGTEKEVWHFFDKTREANSYFENGPSKN